jgi:hypothetical protein
MAGQGRIPRDPSQQHPRAKKVERTKIEAPPAQYPPLPNAEAYLPMTRSWYETWGTSPQASRFLATDWQRLHMLARLVDLFWLEGDKGTMAEIRLNEASLGATEADRLRLHWDIEVPKPENQRAAGTPKRRQDRRDGVMRLVAGGSEG